MSPYPDTAVSLGSFRVIHLVTWQDFIISYIVQFLITSGNSLKQTLAYSSNQSATSGFSQPPRSSSAW